MPARIRHAPRATSKPRVIIICTHLRRDRSIRQTRDYLQSLAGVHVASLIDGAKYDVTLHHEDWHGPFVPDDAGLFDIAFLSGLQADFDRMRQLSYFFRRAGATVIAGGNICSLFPEFASQFFDAVCAGGVECVTDFFRDYERGEFAPIYRSPQHAVRRYAVDYSHFRDNGINVLGHLIETSRGCSFRCDFCVLPAEGARHASYDLDILSETIDNAVRTSPPFSFRRLFPFIYFLDNNFADNLDRAGEVAELLARKTAITAWGALVTQNTLRNRAFIDLLMRCKCRSLFVGIESLDPAFLKSHNKTQNLSKRASVVDDVRYAESRGIFVSFGYLFDPATTTIEEMTEQIDALTAMDDFPMPVFFSFVVPLVGTKFFWDVAAKDRLRANLRLRDFDGETIVVDRTASPIEELAAFARRLYSSPWEFVSARRVLRSTLARVRRIRTLNPAVWLVATMGNARLLAIGHAYRKAVQRNHIGGLDKLDPQYFETPPDLSEPDRRRYFDPVMVTTAERGLADWLKPYAPGSRGEPKGSARRVPEAPPVTARL